MKKLVTQVSGLRTSLPDGIYVRHCSSRLDVMKVLITGPEGTPYENGLFEFDLFCPATFPNQPPRMQFRTTGAGTVRFNPNLYQCGKVCLSLLGTWSGQKWTEQSTILQILVSIQAMIFNDKPWYNEPGRERTPDEAASQRYNSQVQGWTLQHAI
ncbi:UBC-like protein, partial [Thozetella sp. PMI_491]